MTALEHCPECKQHGTLVPEEVGEYRIHRDVGDPELRSGVTMVCSDCGAVAIMLLE